MKKIYLLLLIFGIALRFIFQFVFPTFNVDEISLGNNLKYFGFSELSYPLKYGQSAPPLFLYLEKTMISLSPLDFWINIKIMPFLSSCLGIILFYLFIKKYNYNELFLLLFIILIFNPFNLSNSLTVKQYTFDLTGTLFLLLSFKSKTFIKYNWIFFLFWTLLSNIGLFACAGYLIYLFFKDNYSFDFKKCFNFIKNNIYTIVSPLPYIIYFLWFMNQNGAKELKEYMVGYWSNTFIPFDNGIFKYLLYTIHGLWIFIFNAFEIWGILMMVLLIPLFIYYKKVSLFRDEIVLLSAILFVHLILNIFHLYPFSDRLYLYLSVLFIIMLGSSLDILQKMNYMKKNFRLFNISISCVTLILYFFYLPFTDNDVYGIFKKTENYKMQQCYATEKTLAHFKSFVTFTDNKLTSKTQFLKMDTTLRRCDFLISRVAKKIKRHVTSDEEDAVLKLIKKNKIEKIDFVNGFNIYKIKK